MSTYRRENNENDKAESKYSDSYSVKRTDRQQKLGFDEVKSSSSTYDDDDVYSKNTQNISHQDIAELRSSFYDKKSKTYERVSSAKYFRDDRVLTYWYSLGYGKPKHQSDPISAKIISFTNDSTYTIELDRNKVYIDDVPEAELELDIKADDKNSIIDIKKPLIRLASILNPNFQKSMGLELELKLPLGSQFLHQIIKLLGDKYIKELQKAFKEADHNKDGEIDVLEVIDVVNNIKVSGNKAYELIIESEDILSWSYAHLKKKKLSQSRIRNEEKGSSSPSSSRIITFNVPEFLLLYINNYHPIVGGAFNKPPSNSGSSSSKSTNNDETNRPQGQLIDYTCQSQSPFFKNNEFKDISKFASVFGKKLIYDLEDAFNHFAIVAKDSNSRYDNSSYDNDDNDYEEVQDLDLKRILRNRKKLLLRNVLEAFAVMGRGLPLNVFQAWSVAHLFFDVFFNKYNSSNYYYR